MNIIHDNGILCIETSGKSEVVVRLVNTDSSDTFYLNKDEVWKVCNTLRTMFTGMEDDNRDTKWSEII